MYGTKSPRMRQHCLRCSFQCFKNSLLKHNSHKMSCTHLECKLCSLLTYVCTCETFVTIKIMKLAIMPQSFFMPLCNLALTSLFPSNPDSMQPLMCFLSLYVISQFQQFYINGITPFGIQADQAVGGYGWGDQQSNFV